MAEPDGVDRESDTGFDESDGVAEAEASPLLWLADRVCWVVEISLVTVGSVIEVEVGSVVGFVESLETTFVGVEVTVGVSSDDEEPLCVKEGVVVSELWTAELEGIMSDVSVGSIMGDRSELSLGVSDMVVWVEKVPLVTIWRLRSLG